MPELSVVPTSSLAECWLPLSAFNVRAETKNGCGGFRLQSVSNAIKLTCYITYFLLSVSRPVYPSNSQMALHVTEFLRDGYRRSAEAIEIKFPVVDGTRAVLHGQVGISDGYCKILLMYGIVLILHKLEARTNM